MIAIMCYVALVSAGIAAAAAACESVCRVLRVPTRWGWIGGLALALLATAAVMLWPLPEAEVSVSAASAAPSSFVMGEVSGPAISPAVLEGAGVAATVGWIGASALLLGLLGVGALTLMRERRMAGRSVVHGHDVLLTDGVGPAVSGLAKPVALIPRWVLEMDETSQRLLLAHEMEHVRARDSVVLASGAVVAALLPWNPLAWWMLRRLRLAVEMDCDRRVLAREASVRRYAELLLMTARMPSAHARLLAAGLGEGESDLERRIVAMTESSPRRWLTRAVVPGVLAAAVVLVACETPRPDPIGPGATGADGLGAVAPADVEREVRIDRLEPKRVATDTVIDAVDSIVYAELPLRVKVDSIEFAKLRAPREVRVPLPSRRVDAEPEVRVRRLSEEGKVVQRDPNSEASPVDVVILSSDGRELAAERSTGKVVSGALARLDPEQIASIEVYKGSLCQGTRCPRITVTLKPGAKLR